MARSVQLTSPSKMALRRSRFVGQSTGGDLMSSLLDEALLASLLPPHRLARLLRRCVCRNTQHSSKTLNPGMCNGTACLPLNSQETLSPTIFPKI